MRNLLRFFLRYRILLALFLIQGSGLFLTYRNSGIHESLYWDTVLSIQGSWNGFRTGWKDYFNLRATNAALQEENTFLRAKLSQPGVLTINAVDSNQFNWVAGNVIYGTSHLRNNVLLVNKGKNNGVFAGQGVLSSQGVLGVVSESNAHFSKVTSLLHSKSRISGVVSRSGFYGTVIWEGGPANELLCIDLALEADLKTGDTVVTDGRSSIFPAGWPIGVVREVKNDPSLSTKTAMLELLGTISRQQPAYIVDNRRRQEQNDLLTP